MLTKLVISPRPAAVPQDAVVGFYVKGFDEKGNEISVVPVWNCCGGTINVEGEYLATSGGPCTVYCSKMEGDIEIKDELTFAIERKKEKLQGFFKKPEVIEKPLQQDFTDTKRIIDSVKKLTDEQIKQRSRLAREQYRTLGSHTRAVIRMSTKNKSLINLALCLIAGVGFGVALMVLLFDFNSYAILLLILSAILMLKGGIVAVMESKGPLELRLAEKYENLVKNQDLLWVALAIVASVIIGASAYMLVNGVAISTIVTLFTSLLALFLSIIGKASSNQGEISRAMTKRIHKSADDTYYTIDERNQ